MKSVSIEHSLDDEERAAVTSNLPAMPDEQQRNLIQMQQIAEMTVSHADRMMRLPCKRAVTTEDSTRWTIEVEHPVEGEITFRVDKPVHGWHDECDLAKLLAWYNIDDQNPYRLQREWLYVQYQGEASTTPHGWELVAPPWTVTPPTATERARRSVEEYLPARTVTTVWLTIGLAPLIAGALATIAGFTAPLAFAPFVLGSVVVYLALSIICAAVLDPPEEL